MPMRTRQNARRFAVRFTQIPISGARDQSASTAARLHHRQQRREIVRSQRQLIPNTGQIAVGSIIVADDVKDDARDQCVGLLVPMRFGFMFIEHQSVGKRHRIFGQIEAARVKPVERIVTRRWCP